MFVVCRFDVKTNNTKSTLVESKPGKASKAGKPGKPEKPPPPAAPAVLWQSDAAVFPSWDD